MKIKKLKIDGKGLLSALILQFFLYQFIKMSLPLSGNWYTSGLIKFKSLQNSIFGVIPLSVGDVFYFVLAVFLLYYLLKSIILFIRKRKEDAGKYLTKLLWGINIFYALFMLSFGLLYSYRQFIAYDNPQEKLYLKDLKAVANYLFTDCRNLREDVSVNKNGEFAVDTEEMISLLYTEQSIFFQVSAQKPNVKISFFSPLMRKIGVAGYYNPFTGEAQMISGYPDTSIPFTIAHEMGHQAGVAREDEANFYSFYMGESSANKEFQYSVKYKAFLYVLSEIYINDSVFVKRILDNFSEGMKKDREREIKFYSQSSTIGSDLFSYMNDTYLKSNNQEGIVAYNQVVQMIVNFYKKSNPDLFIKAEESELPYKK